MLLPSRLLEDFQAGSPPVPWIGEVTGRMFGKVGVAQSLAHVCG